MDVMPSSLNTILMDPELTPRAKDLMDSILAAQTDVTIGTLIKAVRKAPELNKHEKGKFVHLLMAEALKVKMRENAVAQTTVNQPSVEEIAAQAAWALLEKKTETYGHQLAQIFAQNGKIGTDPAAMPVVPGVPVNNFLSNAETVFRHNYGEQLPCIDARSEFSLPERSYLVMDPDKPDTAIIVSYDSKMLARLNRIFARTNDRGVAPRVLSLCDLDSEDGQKRKPKLQSNGEPTISPDKTCGSIMVITDFNHLGVGKIVRRTLPKADADLKPIMRALAQQTKRISETRPIHTPLN